MALICFDFDKTLVNGHFHNELTQSVGYNEFVTKNHVQSLIDKYGLRNQKEYLEVILTALKNGHQVAITSFTKFINVISPTLEALDLIEEEINKVYYKTGFPPGGQGNPNKKNLHIKDVMEKVGLDPKNIKDRKKVWLIDDDQENINRALIEDFNGILVPPSNEEGFIAATKLVDIIIKLNTDSQILTSPLETHTITDESKTKASSILLEKKREHKLLKIDNKNSINDKETSSQVDLNNSLVDFKEDDSKESHDNSYRSKIRKRNIADSVSKGI